MLMSIDDLKKEFVPKYISVGKEKFYNFLLTYAMNKLVSIDNGSYNGISPELEFMEYHDQFLTLYRREGEDVLLDLAKVFRKAAHRFYRALLKKEKTTINPKFLNLVQ
jgi:hypothetical protein